MMRHTTLVNFISGMGAACVAIFICGMIGFLVYQMALGLEAIHTNGLRSIIMPLWEGTNGR